VKKFPKKNPIFPGENTKKRFKYREQEEKERHYKERGRERDNNKKGER
jgi:hypothetical protein